MQETCLGIALVEERPLNDEERALLQQETRHSLGRSCAWGCATPVVLITLIMIWGSMSVGHDNDSAVQTMLACIALVVFFGLPAFFILRANDQYKIRQTALQDLRKGSLKYYHGFAPGVQIDEAPSKGEEPASENPGPLAKIANVEIPLLKPITLEIFSGSRRLWQVNGIRVKKLICLPEEHTARQPEQARIAAKWVEPAQITTEHTIDFSQIGRRDLSSEEKEEIRRRTRTVWQRPGWGALFFTGYFGGIALLQWSTKTPLHVKPIAYLYIALTIWADSLFIKVAWWAWRLAKDAKHGVVLITRMPDKTKNGEFQSKGSVIEWLPFSKSKWSINGQPAAWRLQRQKR